MAYPLINGAAINANANELRPTRGIPMVLSGHHRAAYAVQTPGFDALAFGKPKVVGKISPQSLLLAQEGQAIAKFLITLYPASLPLSEEGQGQLMLTAFAEPADALVLGTPKAKSGRDVALKPWGLQMARTGKHIAQESQPLPDVVYLAQPSRAMRYGTAALVQPAWVARAEGSNALHWGRTQVRQAFEVASGGSAVVLGRPGIVLRVRAAGVQALRWGRPGQVAQLRPAGMALVRSGVATARHEAMTFQAQSKDALHWGHVGSLKHGFWARQSYALELGRPSVTRNHQC